MLYWPIPEMKWSERTYHMKKTPLEFPGMPGILENFAPCNFTKLFTTQHPWKFQGQKKS